MTFATYIDLQNWSGRSVATDDRARTDMLLETASDYITEEAGWHIAPSVSETLRLDGPGGLVLNLPSKKVTALTQIAWADRRLAAPIVVDPSAYVWNESGTVEMTHAAFPWWLEWTIEDVVGYPNVFPVDVASLTVTLTHGYATVPRTVKDVVCDMVSLAVNVPSTLPRGVTQMTTGSVSMSFDYRQALGRLEFSDTHRHQLARYML